jgi:hypothetical protein
MPGRGTFSHTRGESGPKTPDGAGRQPVRPPRRRGRPLKPISIAITGRYSVAARRSSWTRTGGFVVRFTVRNESAKDLTFDWGSHQGTVKAGKSHEHTAKSAAAPKEIDRHCSVTFENDASFMFKANAWTTP